jgi:hypothetical protein
MLRIKDPDQFGKTAKLDANDNPVKIVADCFKIRMYRYDEVPAPHLEVVCARVDPGTLEEIGPLTSFDLKGRAFLDAITKDGIKIKDIERAIVNHGNMRLEEDESLPNHFESIIDKLKNN